MDEILKVAVEEIKADVEEGKAKRDKNRKSHGRPSRTIKGRSLLHKDSDRYQQLSNRPSSPTQQKLSSQHPPTEQHQPKKRRHCQQKCSRVIGAISAMGGN